MEAERSDQPSVAGGAQHDRRAALLQIAQRRQVEMVVVVVAQQDDVDGRKILECNAGPAHTAWSHETERARPFRPLRIGQDRRVADLDQERRVVDEGDGDVVRRKRLVQPRHAPVLHRGRPAAARLARHLEDASQCRRKALSRQGRIEEAPAVEMIGARPARGRDRRLDAVMSFRERRRILRRRVDLERARGDAGHGEASGRGHGRHQTVQAEGLLRRGIAVAAQSLVGEDFA